MSYTSYLAVFVAGVGAGVINSFAGGGTLLTFPVLVWAGRDPVVANATNALALWPGALASAFALRHEAARAKDLLRLLLPVTLVGSLVGGVLLLATPARLFSAIVPYLVLAATLLIVARRPLTRFLPAVSNDPSARSRRAGVLLGVQLLVAIYGGYFGAAVGILMIAALGLYGVSDMHVRNGVKNVLGAAINGLAGIYFACSGVINWLDALVLSVSAVIGGYAGASFSRGLSPRVGDALVFMIGILATLALALRGH
jgi:uncharacterized membrane protein YfcA